MVFTFKFFSSSNYIINYKTYSDINIRHFYHKSHDKSKRKHSGRAGKLISKQAQHYLAHWRSMLRPLLWKTLKYWSIRYWKTKNQTKGIRKRCSQQ